MPHRYIWRKAKDFIIHRVLRLDDTPHRIALGVAIGIFITWTPTIGFQMVLVLAMATALRANKLVGVPFVWISNPLTLVPVYGPSYFIGGKLLGGRYEWAAFTDAVDMAINGPGNWIEKIEYWFEALWPIFPPLWLGSMIVAALLGAITYAVMYYGVIAYREHKGLGIGM